MGGDHDATVYPGLRNSDLLMISMKKNLYSMFLFIYPNYVYSFVICLLEFSVDWSVESEWHFWYKVVRPAMVSSFETRIRFFLIFFIIVNKPTNQGFLSSLMFVLFYTFKQFTLIAHKPDTLTINTLFSPWKIDKASQYTITISVNDVSSFAKF